MSFEISQIYLIKVMFFNISSTLLLIELSHRWFDRMDSATAPLKVANVYGGYRVDKELGGGAFGYVFGVTELRRGTSRAMKVVSNNNPTLSIGIASEKNAYKIINEKRTNDMCVVPRCERSFQLTNKSGYTYTAFVFAEFGPSLFDVMVLNKGLPFPPKQVISITKQLLEAVQFLHEKCDILHLDIKPENVLFASHQFKEIRLNQNWGNVGTFRVMDNSSVRLIDYNSCVTHCRRDNRKLHGEAVTMHYRAPEIIFDLEYDGKVDIFAIGAMSFEMFLGCTVFGLNDTKYCSLAQNLVLGQPPQEMMRAAFDRIASGVNNVGLVKRICTADDVVVYIMQWPGVTQGKMEKYLEGVMPLKDYFNPMKTGDYNHKMFHTIRQLMAVDPSTRPNATEALKLPLFCTPPTQVTTGAPAQKIKRIA